MIGVNAYRSQCVIGVITQTVDICLLLTYYMLCVLENTYLRQSPLKSTSVSLSVADRILDILMPKVLLN